MPDRDQDSTAPRPSAGESSPRGLSLHTRIFIGLLAGAVAGTAAHVLAARRVSPGAVDALDRNSNGLHDALDWLVEGFADPVGRIFLRLIFMVVVPLVFAALVLGAAGLGNVRRIGRVGLRTLALTLVLSTGAVAIGVGLTNLIRPGSGLDDAGRQALHDQFAFSAEALVHKAEQAKSFKDTLLDLIPENPLQEAVGALDGSSKGNGMLAVMFFALVFGVALTALPQERAAPLLAVLESVFEACMVIIGFVMRLAPCAVACLVFAITSRLGLDIVAMLTWFVVTVLVGLGIQFAIVYPLFIRTLGGMSPMAFFRLTSDALLTAFGTSSSNATLPTSLRVATESLKLPRDVSHFVLTVGATGNQNGTALYEGAVVLFLAQAFGVDLTLSQQIMVVLLSVLAGVGTAGVPGGSLPLIVIVLQSVGVPGEGIGIILGVDRLLDMCRTVLNVAGDLAIATCVSRWEPRSEDEGS